MQICHNTRKTNPWVKAKVANGRCLSYSRTGQGTSRWLVGWLVSGVPTFVIWHHSLIHSRDLAPLINSVLVLVTSAKVKAFYGIANKVN